MQKHNATVRKALACFDGLPPEEILSGASDLEAVAQILRRRAAAADPWRGLKTAPKRNQWTRKPRLWACQGNRHVDILLEIAEVLAAYKEAGKSYRDGMASIPARFRREMAHSLNTLSIILNVPPAELTEMDRRYCRLEGIKPSDFLARKRASL